MKLTNLEKQVRSILNDVTGYDFTKNEDEDGVYYQLIDLYGDVDGDPFDDFDDLITYICNNDDVEAEINTLFAAA